GTAATRSRQWPCAPPPTAARWAVMPTGGPIGTGRRRRLGINTHIDLPGVGENLLDHPESVIVWETEGPLSPNSAMDSDAGLFLRLEKGQPRPDLMFHFYQVPFTVNTERLGYPSTACRGRRPGST